MSSGLLNWANSIRITMASDPGRQVFKDQVQTHGFLFLDDYLDNIVSGGKQDPLIELVKTPGRKKAIARKPKLMSSKLGNVDSVLFEPNDENVVPESVGQRTSFKTKDNHFNLEHSSSKEKPNNEPALASVVVDQQHSQTPLASIQAAVADHQMEIEQNLTGNLSGGLVVPIVLDQNNLSVIAEDDEPMERSGPSTASKDLNAALDASNTQLPPLTQTVPEMVNNEPQTDINISSTSSIGTFYSIPLLSSVNPEPTAIPTQIEKHNPSITSGAHHHSTVIENDRIQPSKDIQEFTMTDIQEESSARQKPPASSGEEGTPVFENVFLQSLKEIQEFAMAELPQEEFTPGTKERDKSPPSFPTLPQPMPLRKSMRVPQDPSLNAVMQGAATPGAVGGKRTSWLMKAREVKALEVTHKRSHVASSDFNVFGLSNPVGTKRKSEEAFPIAASLHEERQPKVLKITEQETAPRQSKEMPKDKIVEKTGNEHKETTSTPAPPQEGVLDRLKKTMEGFGVRVGKTMGKSLGGEAATALAEAKAAAEARIAERDRKEEESTVSNKPDPSPIQTDVVAPRQEVLRIEDLFPSEGRVKEKHKVPENPFFSLANQRKELPTIPADASTKSSPTPVNSVRLPEAPVFSRQLPVFIPPPLSKPTTTTTHQSVFFQAKNDSYAVRETVAAPLTAHSTLESVQPDNLFDDDDRHSWIPSTQDTEYATYTQSQPQNTHMLCDDDDSWPLDEKLSGGVQWTFEGSKEDSMTWSTLPSQSQRGDTGPVTRTSPIREEERHATNMPRPSLPIPGAFHLEQEREMDGNLLPRDVELEELLLGSSKETQSDTEEPKATRSESQMSLASSASSQPQAGFLNQASKIITNALGTSKKKQPEVKKVLQMAAVAAKKQQEEADKKAARLKEMESRRQLAIQRKTEEEKAKAWEEERKMKEEAERRRKEKEELTEKRSLKIPPPKKDEDVQKKKKTEIEKKREIKKPGASILLAKSQLKPVANALDINEEVSQPSRLVHSQMAARAKAQIEAAKQTEPAVPSESIELPDINSEYSDSEDEDRPRTFDPPEWAQSPELRQALEMQSTINPDEIFGAVRPLKMEELFKKNTSRFRARTSSANWTGTDRLTVQEEKEYARRMGFK